MRHAEGARGECCTQTLAFETDCHIFDGLGFPAPGLHSFLFKPIFDAVGSVVLQQADAAGAARHAPRRRLLLGRLRKPKLVPGKLQLVGEIGYDFVRRGIVSRRSARRARSTSRSWSRCSSSSGS